MPFADSLALEIAGARPKHLDYLARQLWSAHANGTIDDATAQGLAEALQARQRRPMLSIGGPSRIARSAYPKRPYQRSPDRAASIVRRRRLEASGPLPPAMACRFTTGELAVLKVVGDEVRQHGACSIHLDAIAARAGVCRRLAQAAIRLAFGLGLLVIEERRRRGLPSLTNIVRIISAEWKVWLSTGEGAKGFRPRSQVNKQEQIRSRYAAGSSISRRQTGEGGGWGEAASGFPRKENAS